ncbi:MAG: hypothetical protein EOP00_20545 [Pedobacter sp.]|nr:MAG: hypothetical protein EOP00_20545 [Pedobacter sp.]
MKVKISNYFIIIGLLLSSCGQISHAEFDAEKWKNSDLNTEENWDLRWRMMNDLRKNHELVGMKKAEIKKFLENLTVKRIQSLGIFRYERE